MLYKMFWPKSSPNLKMGPFGSKPGKLGNGSAQYPSQNLLGTPPDTPEASPAPDMQFMATPKLHRTLLRQPLPTPPDTGLAVKQNIFEPSSVASSPQQVTEAEEVPGTPETEDLPESPTSQLTQEASRFWGDDFSETASTVLTTPSEAPYTPSKSGYRYPDHVDDLIFDLEDSPETPDTQLSQEASRFWDDTPDTPFTAPSSAPSVAATPSKPFPTKSRHLSPKHTGVKTPLPCNSCSSLIPPHLQHPLPCTHLLCAVCTRQTLVSSLISNPFTPAACPCSQSTTIPKAILRQSVTYLQFMAYADKLTEHSIPTGERLYCHNPQCKRFINPKLDMKRGGKVGTCGHCGGNTCKRCGQKGHMFGVSQQACKSSTRTTRRRRM
ncbi:hypothetical protein QBC40DRAFT_281582 [Triangularia verruculosa]|uniref:IBR domain-containing protein n=1 Tax=Triangularia verruculosa TaxID=2587418 RepID=A0AAN6XG71_9PEZI|nr:hypothetical protein QBC40DRAFT_281582 [Triangularia verruculosa]